MKTHKAALFVGIAVAAMAAWYFIGGERTSFKASNPTMPPRMSTSIALWMEGEESGAIEVFLGEGALPEESGIVVSVLEMSERDFVGLGIRAQRKADEANTAVVNAIGQIGRELMARVEQARARDDSKEADRILSRLRDMADELSTVEHTLLLRQIGEYLRKIMRST